MTYLQNNNSEHKKFIKKHQEAFLQIGIPLQTLQLQAWTYLLEHGVCFYTGWNSKDLDKLQAKRLLDLVDEYGGKYSPMLKTDLTIKIKQE